MVQKDTMITLNGLQKLRNVLFNCAIADPVKLSVPQNDAKWLCICLFGHRFAYIYIFICYLDRITFRLRSSVFYVYFGVWGCVCVSTDCMACEYIDLLFL